MEEIKFKTKFEIFNEDFSNRKCFEQNVEKIFQYMFYNIFPNILNLPRIDFINSLASSVKAILEKQYSNKIYSNEEFFSLFFSVNKSFEKKYSQYNQLLSSSWDNYQNELYSIKKEEDLQKYKLIDFRKHCRKTQEYAIHSCSKNEKGNFIIVFDKKNKNDKKFLICDKCRKTFYTTLFINFCQNCECNYYCGLLSCNEDPNFLPATYYSPHCESIANDKIPCTKCKKNFYYDIKENILKCNNPSCQYKIKPNIGSWKCNICSSYFKSEIKIFNNFELLYIKKIVGIALLIKEKGHPGILPCCKNLEENNLIFYHKKDCKGQLFFWILNNKLIVICEKCKAINFFNRFIWTCPNCGLHFKAKKEEIEEKLKKNFLKNLKLNIDINIILGDEFLLNNNCKNDFLDNTDNYKFVRKKSFREILNIRRQDKNKDRFKEIEQKNKINGEEKVMKKIVNDDNNENIIYRINSNNKLNEEVKSSMKKRKNYLFEKLLRNQFLPKNNLSNNKENKNHLKRTKSGVMPSELKNREEDEEMNKILVSEKKMIKLRERSGSNYLKGKIINTDLKKKKENVNKVSKFSKNKENESKLNNSDDAEKVNETSFIMNYNKKKMKNNNYNNSIRKGLPPLPLKIKNGQNYNTNENEIDININENVILDNINEMDNKEEVTIDNRYKNNRRSKYENIDKNKNKLNFKYKLNPQSGYKTPRIIIKNNSETELKDSEIHNNNMEKSSNCLKINNNLAIISNFDSLNIQKEKSGKIVQNLEDKFNDNYTQKKTKNKTHSNDDEEKTDEKEKIEKIDENEFNEINNVNKSNEINNNGDKFNNREGNIILNNEIQSKEKDEINNNENKKKDNNFKRKELKILFRNPDKNQNRDNKDISIININEEKQKKEKKKEMNNNSLPDDIINLSMSNSKLDIPIANSTIKNEEILYSSIQRQIKKILSKGKLPQFNIDNYKIEKQIGEGSFGLIFQVINKKTSMKYAMKKIIANNLSSLETHQKEFEIVHQYSHPNILDILGICIRCLDQTTYVLYVLMDLALYDWDFEIEERKKVKKYYTEDELISILKQISSALSFLQKEKIAHRDVKPENILVFKNGIYKLGDFGEAKINKMMKNLKATIRGTEMYMSPLLFKSLQEDKDDVQHDIFKSDVFSLGYCMIFAASLDFKVINEIRYINTDFKLRKILQRMFFLKYSNDFIELILKMITINEEDRIDFIELQKILENQHF